MEVINQKLTQVIDLLRTKPSARTAVALFQASNFLRRQQGFFVHLDDENATTLCKRLEHRFVPEGDAVYIAGEPADSMFVILQGCCESEVVSEGARHAMLITLPSGVSFGESALVNAHHTRSSSVYAGRGGVHLALLHRGSVNTSRFLAETQPAAARALEALMSACCSRLLCIPPGERTAAEVQDLADFMARMQAFQRLPAAVVSRLAAEVSALTLPAGRVLFEEDAEGNAMYVVVSGACHVRARPLPDVPQRACKGANAVPTVQLAQLGNGGAAGKSLTHGLVSAQSGLKASAKAGRPTSAKSTRSSVAVSCGGDDSGEEEGRQRAALAASRVPSTQQPGQDGTVTKGSPFWIARFMQQAIRGMSLQDGTSATAARPRDEYNAAAWDAGALMPMVAVAAAKWRVAAIRRKGVPEAEVFEEEDKGMDDLLGRAAARALRAANASSSAYHYTEPDTDNAAASTGPAADAALTSAADTSVPGHASSSKGSSGRGGDNGKIQLTEDLVQGVEQLSVQMSSAAETVLANWESGTEEVEAALPVYEQPRQALEDPTKRLLAKMGSSSTPSPYTGSGGGPAAASTALLAELAGRAGLPRVLYALARTLVARGAGGRRLGKSHSRRVAQALHQAIADGGGAAAGGLLAGAKKAGSSRKSMAGTASALAGSCTLVLPNEASQGSTVHMSRRGTIDDGMTTDGDDSPHGYGSPRSDYGHNNAGRGLRGSHSRQSRASTDGAFKSPRRTRRSIHQYQDGPEVDMFELDNVVGLAEEQVEARYGAVLRVVKVGESFGELALLQPNAKRTASVLTAVQAHVPAQAARVSRGGGPWSRVPSMRSRCSSTGTSTGGVDSTKEKTEVQPAPQGSAVGGCGGMDVGHGLESDASAPLPVQLMRISRCVYASTVRAVQLAELAALTDFLASLEPFAGLSAVQRMSLAVFCRPVEMAAGQVVALPGQKADTLFMIQSGEVAMVQGNAVARALAPSLLSATGTAGGLFKNTAAAAGMDGIDARGGAHRTSSLNARPAGASAAITSPRGLYKQISAPSHFTANDPSRRVMFDASAGATKGNVNGSGKSTSGSGMGGGGERREGSLPPLPSYAAVQPGAVLSALGPGSVFGEGVAFTAFEEGHGGGSRRSRPMRVMLRASADGAGEAHSIGGPSHGGAGNSSMAPVRMRAARASDPSSSLPRPTQPQAVTNISSSMAAYPGVYQCGVIARKATKLLALSACDVARLGSEVIGRLKVLSDARSLLMAQRSDSIKAARVAVQGSMAQAKAVLGAVSAYSAAGLSAHMSMHLKGVIAAEQRAAVASAAAEESVALAEEARRQQRNAADAAAKAAAGLRSCSGHASAAGDTSACPTTAAASAGDALALWRTAPDLQDSLHAQHALREGHVRWAHAFASMSQGAAVPLLSHHGRSLHLAGPGQQQQSNANASQVHPHPHPQRAPNPPLPPFAWTGHAGSATCGPFMSAAGYRLHHTLQEGVPELPPPAAHAAGLALNAAGTQGTARRECCDHGQRLMHGDDAGGGEGLSTIAEEASQASEIACKASAISFAAADMPGEASVPQIASIGHAVAVSLTAAVAAAADEKGQSPASTTTTSSGRGSTRASGGDGSVHASVMHAARPAAASASAESAGLAVLAVGAGVSSRQLPSMETSHGAMQASVHATGEGRTRQTAAASAQLPPAFICLPSLPRSQRASTTGSGDGSEVLQALAAAAAKPHGSSMHAGGLLPHQRMVDGANGMDAFSGVHGVALKGSLRWPASVRTSIESIHATHHAVHEATKTPDLVKTEAEEVVTDRHVALGLPTEAPATTSVASELAHGAVQARQEDEEASKEQAVSDDEEDEGTEGKGTGSDVLYSPRLPVAVSLSVCRPQDLAAGGAGAGSPLALRTHLLGGGMPEAYVSPIHSPRMVSQVY